MTSSSSSPSQVPSITAKPAVGLRPFLRFGILTFLGIAFALLLFLWLINSSFIYNPKKELSRYTHFNFNTSSIDRFSVRNFFYLDGPDFSYELTLSPDDKASLVKLFVERGNGTTSNVGAEEQVPSSWIGGAHHQLEHYYFSNKKSSGEVGVFLDIESESNKAWLVIQTY